MTQCIAITFNPKNVTEVKDAVRSFASIDRDFSGENGKEYLWGEAKGYTSNCEYMIEKYFNKSFENTDALVDAFEILFKKWFAGDNYYVDHDIDTITLDDDQFVGIALAVTTV